MIDNNNDYFIFINWQFNLPMMIPSMTPMTVAVELLVSGFISNLIFCGSEPILSL